MRTNRIVVVAAMMLGGVAWLSLATADDGNQAPAGVKVTPIGIERRFDAPQVKDMRFSKTPSVEIELLVEAPAGGMIELDREESKITFTAGKKKLNGAVGMMPKFSPDGRYAIVDVKCDAPPTEATKLQCEGTLVLQAATQTRSEKAANIALKAGTTFEVGSTKWTVKTAGKPQWGDDAMEVELNATADLTAFKEVRFVDGDGQVIESRQTSSMEMKGAKVVQVSKTYALKRKVSTATLEFVYWKDMATLRVPLDVAASAGWVQPKAPAQATRD